MAYEITVVAKGELDDFYPISVAYSFKGKVNLLLESKKGKFVIKSINDDGTLGSDVSSGVFKKYYDLVQVANNEGGRATFICAISTEGKRMEVMSIQNDGSLKPEFITNYDIDDDRAVSYYVSNNELYSYRHDNTGTGKYIISRIDMVN